MACNYCSNHRDTTLETRKEKAKMKLEFTVPAGQAVERIKGTFGPDEIISVVAENVNSQKLRKALNSLESLFKADVVQVRFVNSGGFVLFEPKNFRQRKITFDIIAGNIVVVRDELEDLVGPDPF